MPRISVDLSEDLDAEITKRARAIQQDKIAEIVANRSVRKDFTQPGVFPISYGDWLMKSPEGKRYMHDCMSFKFRDLPQRELDAIGRQLYHDSFPPEVIKRVKNEEVVPSLKGIKNKLIEQILSREFLKPDNKLTLVFANKNK